MLERVRSCVPHQRRGPRQGTPGDTMCPRSSLSRQGYPGTKNVSPDEGNNSWHQETPVGGRIRDRGRRLRGTPLVPHLPHESALAAQQPAPYMAASPTRPSILSAMPPEETPAATHPARGTSNHHHHHHHLHKHASERVGTNNRGGNLNLGSPRPR